MTVLPADKGSMMKHVLAALALIAIFASCESDSSTPQETQPVTEKHIIRDVDYIKHKYFYFDDPHSFIGPRAEDPRIEVFRTVLPQDILAHPEILRLRGWVVPDPAGDGQAIRDVAAVLKSGGAPFHAEREDFQLLTFGVDYDFMIDANTNRAIGVDLFDPIPDTALKALAVRYINETGISVGGSFHTLGVADGDSTLMLEMLKAPDQRPEVPYGSTWRLEMRNAYDLGWHNAPPPDSVRIRNARYVVANDLQPGSIKIVIRDILSARQVETRPEGSTVRYLRIFGLDQVGKNGTGSSDGLVDSWYVDFPHGILWMPSLHGFAPEPEAVSQWTDGEFAFTGQYQAQYDSSLAFYNHLLNPTEEADHHQYDIHVTKTLPTP
jgi:hypothetical protein